MLRTKEPCGTFDVRLCAGADLLATSVVVLEKTGVVGTPGSGFGKNGQGFFRLTAFAQEETVRKAMAEFERIFS